MIAVLRAARLARLVHRLSCEKDCEILWGPASMVPQPRDLGDARQHLRWFLGRGPRPRFDHFTYWEKFDYWAVFWGMGDHRRVGAGAVVPGVLRAAAARLGRSTSRCSIHGEEALLAVGFIFTIHFFNSHLRPEKFPMDPVIFTGARRRSTSCARSGRPSTSGSRRRSARRARLAAADCRRVGDRGARSSPCVAVTLGLSWWC